MKTKYRSNAIVYLPFTISILFTILIFATSTGTDVLALDIALVVVVWIFAMRLASTNVSVEPGGLRINNLVTSRYVEWQEIDNIRTGGRLFDIRAFGSPATIRQTDGTVRFMVAVQPSLFMQFGRTGDNVDICESLIRVRDTAIANGGVLASSEASYSGL